MLMISKLINNYTIGGRKMLNVLVDDPQGVARKEKELWKMFTNIVML